MCYPGSSEPTQTLARREGEPGCSELKLERHQGDTVQTPKSAGAGADEVAPLWGARARNDRNQTRTLRT